MNDATAAVLPIRTERLVLRMMRSTDAAVLAAYRDDPEVARYQSWDLPFSEDDARRALAGQDELGDITPGDWVQVAIERDGTVVGDLAVGLDASTSVATIGYTLAPAHQGLGYASEAVDGLLGALFDRTRVHRVLATLDPANVASMRVIEPLGFVWEGTARQAEPIRGEWTDDMRFALLREDWPTWRARPRHRPDTVQLVEITPDLVLPVSRLTTFRHQERFVSPMARSIAQALVPPIYGSEPVIPWYRAILADGELVGFVMLSLASPTDPVPYLWRLLIDRAHQRRRIGERVVALVVNELRSRGHDAMLVNWVEGRGSPRPFYERLGFEDLGPEEDETLGRLRFDGWSLPEAPER